MLKSVAGWNLHWNLLVSLFVACFLASFLPCSLASLLHRQPATSRVDGSTGTKESVTLSTVPVEPATAVNKARNMAEMLDGRASTARSTAEELSSQDPTSDLGVPPVLPPSSLCLLFINISAVQLSWSYRQVGDGQQPVEFLVQVSRDDNPYLNISGLSAALEFVYNEMVFGAYYHFQVLASVGGVVSEPVESDYFINGVTAPPGPPTGIHAVIVLPWELRIEWEMPSTPTPPIYIVRWGESPINLSNTRRVYQATYVNIDNLKSESDVYFHLRMDISGRQSVWSSLHNVSMPTPYVSAPVIVNYTVSTQWVWLKWRLSLGHPFVSNYRVSKFKLCITSNGTSSEDTPPQPLTSSCPPAASVSSCQCRELEDSATTSTNVTELVGNTSYEFFLKFWTSVPGVVSRWSKELELSTLPERLLTCVSCASVSADQVRLRWTMFGGIPLQSLRLLPCNNSTPPTSWMSHSELFDPPLPSSSGMIIVGDLRPWTTYSIALVSNIAYLSSRQATCCPVDSCTTLESVPSAPPSEVAVENVSAHTIFLRVSPPTELNGRLSGFAVKLFCLKGATGSGEDTGDEVKGRCEDPGNKKPHNSGNCSKDQKVLEMKKDSSVMEQFVIEVKGLFPSLRYHLQVAAVTGAGVGPYSSNVTVCTQSEDNSPNDSVDVSLLATTIPTVILFTVSTAIIFAVLFFIKQLRKKRIPLHSEMAMEGYRSPRTIWNSYVPVRTGDGQSSRHSSVESLASVSIDLTSTTSTATTAGVAHDKDSESSFVSVSLVSQWYPQHHQLSPGQNCEDNFPPSNNIGVIGFRSSPDGSSLSSDDEKS